MSLKLVPSSTQQRHPNAYELWLLSDAVSASMPGVSHELVRRALSISNYNMREVVIPHRVYRPELTYSQYKRCIRTIRSGAAQRLVLYYKRQDELKEVARMQETIDFYAKEITRLNRLVERLRSPCHA